MNMLCPRLHLVAPAPLSSTLGSKLSVIHPFHLRNVFSTEAHSQDLFSHFAHSKLNMSGADIARMFRSAPHLQKLRTLDNVERFPRLLKKYGCTEDQIVHIMKVKPRLLGTADTILEPKIKMLEDFGFVDRNLVKLLTGCPSLLERSLENELLPKMEFLKNVFQSEDVFVKSLSKVPRVLSNSLEKILKPSLAYWEGWGFRGAELASFLQVNPAVLSRTSLTPARIDLIHKIAAHTKGKMFKYMVSVVTISRMASLEAKIENFKLCGLSTEETWQLLGALPHVILCSKESITEKMNLLVKKMELPVDYVVKHANLLIISLEKTMRPRWLVLQKIKSTDDLDLPLLTALRMPEARFVSKIIKGHPESETLLKIYENAISNAPTVNRTKRSTHQF